MNEMPSSVFKTSHNPQAASTALGACYQGNVHVSQSSLSLGVLNHAGDRSESPQKHQSLAAEFLKFFRPTTESNDLCGAHEREVKSIKEEHNVFSFVVR